MTSPAGGARTPIIDVCGTEYDAEAWRACLLHFADESPAYLSNFAAQLSQRAGVAHATYQSALADSPRRGVEVLLEAGGLATTPERLVQRMDAEGIRYQVLVGAYTPLGNGETINDRVARMAREVSDRAEGWAGLNLGKPAEALNELTRCVQILGMKGGTLVPFDSGIDPIDPRCHEIYGRAAEMRVPLWIHTGMNFSSSKPLDSCTWMHIDRVAIAHPRLRIVVGHGGWPWVLEGMAVLQRHRHVYLEFSAHRPKIMGRPGSGWEPLFFYGKSLVRDQILFGSSSFVQKQTTRELADELEQLGLPDDVTNAWLHGNAARLLGVKTP